MATLKGKWRFNRELVFPEESVYAACVFKCGDVDFLSNPNDYNYALSIIFNKQELRIQGTLIVYNKTWQSGYDYWSVIDFGNTDRIVSRKFYDVFIANATPIIEETVSVMYDGKKITDIGFGQTATLSTKDTILKGDFSISVRENTDLLNIAYGDEEPKDTTKLWVKCNPPREVILQPDYTNFPEDEGWEYTVKKLTEVLPSEMDKPICVEYNNNIYILDQQQIHIFNPEKNVIQYSINMRGSGYKGSLINAIVSGQQIYAFYSSNFDTYMYTIDPLTFSCGEHILLDIPMFTPSVAIVGYKVYLFGGYVKSSGWDYVLSNTICVHDILKNSTQIIEGTSLYEAACEICAITFNNKIYLFGGYRGMIYPEEGSNFHYSDYSDKFYIFYPGSNTLEQISVANWSEVMGFAADFGVVKGDEIYLFGRVGGAVNPLIFSYNPAGSYCQYLIHFDFVRMGGAVVNDNIYLFGGREDLSDSYTNSIHCAKRPRSVPREKLLLINNKGEKVTIMKTNNCEITTYIKQALLGDEYNAGIEVKFAIHNGSEWVEYE